MVFKIFFFPDPILRVHIRDINPCPQFQKNIILYIVSFDTLQNSETIYRIILKNIMDIWFFELNMSIEYYENVNGDVDV